MNRLDVTSEIDAESVRLLLADILGTEIADDSTFLAQGGDSFHAVLVVERVEELWGIEADFTAVLQSTPAELAAVLGAAPRLS
ncbi:phosphopantetheine-binding protein [Streptomyces camelliae]|uniref:Phosphopantetheine-binding protein n=1 Tax=Streptomyces camelliae TaxID=3004093 RepID=A0ABY7P2Y5_9ACTN|nr:phosphopantetheine-binding protein [Streptomyces sp. HUAS 2-6]WBO64883.1 phosphopantetheine-binding protein [Streptomyces sp. HUAS 2-6]